jgi:hypothetical protein
MTFVAEDGGEKEESIPWLKKDEDVEKKSEEFDEEAFLHGRVPILRDSVEKELPPRPSDEGRPPRPDKRDPRRYRKRAPWEKEDPETDPGTTSDADFSEDAFLARGSNGAYSRSRSASREVENLLNGDEGAPKRTFVILRRSHSRDGGTSTSISRSSTPFSQSGADSADEAATESDGEAIKSMFYTGNKIPSKTFSRLQMLTNRRTSEPKKPSSDPIERLKEKAREETSNVYESNVDDAMEQLNIDNHDPDKYLEILKESLEQQTDAPIKIEAENEVTDF